MQDESRVEVDRAVLLRVRAALGTALTRSGHLAQRVTHEHLGYCGWRSESDRCVAHRAVIAELDAAINPNEKE